MNRNDIVHIETVKHGERTFTIELLYDQDCRSPLEDDEGVHITCRAGARSQFGNTPLNPDDHAEIARRIAAWDRPREERLARALGDRPLKSDLVDEPLIGMPVYAYSHSSVALSTRSFAGRAHHAEWDSGQSGYVYITAKTALEWMGGKRLTKAKLEKVRAQLASIVERYGQWLNGECYGYVIREEKRLPKTKITIEDEDDTLWGMIGYDYALNEARAHVKSISTTTVREQKS